IIYPSVFKWPSFLSGSRVGCRGVYFLCINMGRGCFDTANAQGHGDQKSTPQKYEKRALGHIVIVVVNRYQMAFIFLIPSPRAQGAKEEAFF
ncbi:MAG TPA: hypothetical protein DCR61_04110, partial [Verrucomicrobiales bacterium]|nr:hypothetical protein [Verrucomicrobiales bacterium]